MRKGRGTSLAHCPARGLHARALRIYLSSGGEPENQRKAAPSPRRLQDLSWAMYRMRNGGAAGEGRRVPGVCRLRPGDHTAGMS